MDKRINKALLQIAENFRSELFLEKLAQNVELSQFHFQKLFKKETGLSPLHYINKIRMEHAVHYMVIYPESKQIEIAFECGFSSPSVFARSFKQYYKTSLSHYKKESELKQKTKQLNKTSSPENQQLPIIYLKSLKISTHSSNLENENLSNLFEKLTCQLEKPTTVYGVFYDVPIHKPLSECRYYAGFESDIMEDTTLIIKEGYYTYFEINGDFQNIAKQIVDFKETRIDNSPYKIDSLIGFEKILLPPIQNEFNYFKSKRTLFIKIKR